MQERLTIFWRILRQMRPLQGWMLLAALLGLLTVACGIGLMSLSAYLISAAALHPSIAALAVAIVGVRLFGVLRGIVRYLERRFSQPLQLLAKQQYPLLETATFVNGQLDYNEIINLDSLVKGEQLEEFYWEAVLGLAAFLHTVFTSLLQDEVGNSHTGRQLNVVWKAFLTEVEQEMEQYQLYRARNNAQQNRTRRTDPLSHGQNRNTTSRNNSSPLRSPETQRRSI